MRCGWILAGCMVGALSLVACSDSGGDSENANTTGGAGNSNESSGSGSNPTGAVGTTTTGAGGGVSSASASNTTGAQTSGGAPGSGGSGGLETAGAAGELAEGQCDQTLSWRVESFTASVARIVEAVAEMKPQLHGVCHGIATALGQTPTGADDPPSDADVDTTCTLAAGAIEVATEGIEDSVTYYQQGCGCASDADAIAACEEDCVLGEDSDPRLCERLCLGDGYSRTSCGDCVSMVTADDEQFVEAMNPHLTTLFPVRVRIGLVTQASDFLALAVDDLVAELDPTCAASTSAELLAAVTALSEATASLVVLAGAAEAVVEGSAPD